MREIDGSHGEGGGQLVRTAVALAAITAQPVRVYNMRARRSNPGLAPQHLAAVKAIASLCGAEVDGLTVKSREIVFRPGALKGGQFDFPVGTAGSITLMLQAVLPVAICCAEPSHIMVSGGTDVRAAPPMDYFRYLLLPWLSRIGVKARIEVQSRGYYPRAGGRISMDVEPSRTLQAAHMVEPGSLARICGFVHVANLPSHIADRMTGSALAELSDFPARAVDRSVLGRDAAVGTGGAIVLVADMEFTRLAASAIAQRGVRAEQLGSEAGRLLREEIASGATLDIHASDQVLIYLALANGASSFLARGLSSHAATTMWLLEQFLPVHFHASQAGCLIRIDVRH